MERKATPTTQIKVELYCTRKELDHIYDIVDAIKSHSGMTILLTDFLEFAHGRSNYFATLDKLSLSLSLAYKQLSLSNKQGSTDDTHTTPDADSENSDESGP